MRPLLVLGQGEVERVCMGGGGGGRELAGAWRNDVGVLEKGDLR